MFTQDTMTPPEEGNARGRRRSHHACLTCRRQKTRCPGERPACSSCVRLRKSCAYPPSSRPQQNERSDERLAHLEEKLDRLLSGSLANNHPSRQQDSSAIDDMADGSERSTYSGTPPASGPEPNSRGNKQQKQQHSQSQAHHQHEQQQQHGPRDQHQHQHQQNQASALTFFDPDESTLRPNPRDINTGIHLYFTYCHRQPIWIFERDEVTDHSQIPEELACSIMALTSRFQDRRHQIQLHGENAKTLIMLRIANGTVEITTIESLCLLSYSSFIDGNNHLGQFHLGLAFQLCRSAMLDLESAYASNDPITERKKRLFWSLQLLEQFYGRQNGLLSVPSEIWRPSYSTSSGHMELDPTAPPLPRDTMGCSSLDESGIWNTSVHLSWVWSQVRKYVSNCEHNNLREPWRHDSMYAKVASDFMETENRIPICHRYDTAKFYKRKIEELQMHRDYWAPWLKEQFTYHAIHTVMNHPFLYIVGAQHNPQLAIPNTFWRRSSELALLHSTWIVRMIDMVVDKQIPLADPFFGHAAAIAATVHLYYCCAAAARLKHKSNTDFSKCRRFLKRFIPTSTACAALDRNLDRMTRMAAGPESMDVEDWMPSKIYLSVPLMWEILQFNFPDDSTETPTAGLLDASLAPAIPRVEPDESNTLEIIVATSPEISINTASGGQEAPTLSYKGPVPSARSSPWSNSVCDEKPSGDNNAGGEQMDFLSFNFTPWLYADSAQFANMDGMTYDGSQNGMTENRGAAWWEAESFSNIMFNHF